METNSSNGAVLANTTFVYDADERLTSKTYSSVGQTYRPIYEKNASGYVYTDNEVMGIALDGRFTDKVTKDGLRRTSSSTFSVGNNTLFSETYSYLNTPKDGKTIETGFVSSVASHVYGTDADSSTFSYAYDRAGNLETVSKGSSLISKYYYDGLNRLRREDNHTAGKTYVWDYDAGGNLLYKKVYALCTDVNLGACLETFAYTYKSEGWRDRLDTYNGQSCTYDSMGNPTVYLGHTLTWEKGRQLKSFDTNTYTYNANGIRTSKTVNGVKHTYTLDGTKILREAWGNNTLIPLYDNEESVCGIVYNDTPYYFIKNLQGDVIAIVEKDANTVAKYSYDAWGVCTIIQDTSGCSIATINPFRYRGYYFDQEIGLYYLQSRYYNPTVGRFVNTDEVSMLLLNEESFSVRNLYNYCGNSPIMYNDPTGYKLFPVGYSDYFYKDYKTSVSKWAAKYAPMGNDVEYGAIIYRFRVLFWKWYFMGETYKGFKTTNWYTVINGLGAGFLTSIGKRFAGNRFWPIAGLTIVGFAHTHPIGHSNKPSGPDIWMKRLGWIVSLRIFPIAVYNNKKVSINYF